MRPRSALQNGLWNAMSRVALGASQILGSILIVRGLNAVGDEAYGTFSYYATVAGLLSTLGVLALPTALTKLSSELRGNGTPDEARALARSVAVLLLLVNALIGLAVLLWAQAGPAHVRPYLYIVAATPLLHVVVRIFTSMLWGNENYKPISIATSVGSFLQFGLIVAGYFLGWGIVGYLFVTVLMLNVFTPLALLIYYLPRIPAMLRTRVAWPARATLRRYVVFASPATLIVFFDAIVWQRSEVVFLERLSGVEQVGYYGLAFSIVAIAVGLGLALINGYFPSISREYGAGNWDEIRRQIHRASLLTVTYSAPLCFGGLATLHLLIPLVYGTEMAPAVPVVHVLLSGLVPAVLAGVLGIAAGALGRLWPQVAIGLVLAIANIALDLVLIAPFGAVGAAVANTATQVGYVGAMLWLVFRITRIRLPWRRFAATLGIALITTYVLPSALLRIDSGSLMLSASIALGAVAYLAALHVSGGIESLGWKGGRIFPIRGRSREESERVAP